METWQQDELFHLTRATHTKFRYSATLYKFLMKTHPLYICFAEYLAFFLLVFA